MHQRTAAWAADLATASPTLAPPIQTTILHAVKLFWTLYGIDTVIADRAVFLRRRIERRISDFNILLWLAILGGLAAILGGGLRLRSSGHRGLASGVLLILAVPGLLYGLLILSAIILQPRWN